MDTTQLKRIADALEEVLRLVKEDQAKTAERMKKYDKEDELAADKLKNAAAKIKLIAILIYNGC